VLVQSGCNAQTAGIISDLAVAVAAVRHELTEEELRNPLLSCLQVGYDLCLICSANILPTFIFFLFARAI
jgi:hypothetical protein